MTAVVSARWWERLDKGTGEGRGSGDLAFSIGAEYEQVSVRLMVREVAQQVEASGIRPVEIVDDNNKSMGRAYGFHEGADSFVEPEL